MPLATNKVDTNPTPVTEEKVHRWLPALAADFKVQPGALCCVDTATGFFAKPTGAATVLFDGIVDQDFTMTYDSGTPAKSVFVRVRKPGRIRVKTLANVTDADLLKKVYIVPNDDSTVTLTVPGAGNVGPIGIIDYVHGARDVTIRPIYQTL
jgi:hypothetical protein